MSVLSLLNPFGWFGSYQAKLSGGNQPGAHAGGNAYGNSAGKPVAPETALRLSTYWACVKIIAQTIGTLPLDLYIEQPDGSRKPATDNALYDLLRHQPSADHDAVEFWEGAGACLAVWGNSYSLKHRMGGRVTALEPLRPYWMNVFRDSDGAPVYRYSDPWSPQTDYGPDDLLHIRGFGFGDLVGLSPIAFAAQTLGTAIAADEAAGSLFRNGMRMSGWFRWKGAGVLTPQQQNDARAALIDPNTGSGNTGKAGILPGEFDWLATNMNPVDAELLNNRRMNVEEICRGFGVPPIVVGHVGPGQTMWGTGVEHINLAFLTTGLRPYLRRIESAIARQLIGRQAWASLVARFDVEELLRTDNKGMAETSAQLVNNGLKTRNEVRRKNYNLPPMAGADSLTVQSALLPIDKLGEVAKLPRDRQVDPGADLPTGQFGQKSIERKYSPDQPRDDHGRFGSGSSPADQRAAFSRTVKEVAAAGLLVAGGAIAASIGVGEAAAVAVVVEHVAGHLLLSALITSGEHILDHLGLDSSGFSHALNSALTGVGLNARDSKATVLRIGLGDALDYLVVQLQKSIDGASGPQKAKDAASNALDGLESKFRKAIADLSVTGVVN